MTAISFDFRFNYLIAQIVLSSFVSVRLLVDSCNVPFRLGVNTNLWSRIALFCQSDYYFRRHVYYVIEARQLHVRRRRQSAYFHCFHSHVTIDYIQSTIAN